MRIKNKNSLNIKDVLQNIIIFICGAVFGAIVYYFSLENQNMQFPAKTKIDIQNAANKKSIKKEEFKIQYGFYDRISESTKKNPQNTENLLSLKDLKKENLNSIKKVKQEFKETKEEKIQKQKEILTKTIVENQIETNLKNQVIKETEKQAEYLINNSLQIASTTNLDEANNLKNKFISKGLPSFIETVVINSITWNRIIVGIFNNKDELQLAKNIAKDMGFDKYQLIAK